MSNSTPQPSAPAVSEDRVAFQRRREARRHAVSAALWIFTLGNLAFVCWITLSGRYGDQIGYHWNSFDNFLLGMGRLTAFLAGYLALIVVLLLARLPFLERIVGFDKLTIWHRWTGHAVIYLIFAHVICTVWGYAKQDGVNWFQEYWNWLTLPQPSTPTGGGVISGSPPPSLSINLGPPTTSPYPGIITATIGTALLVVVLVTSLVIVRRKLSYEWWYAIHFTAYAGIALAWFHQIPDGDELVAADKPWGWSWTAILTVTNYWRLLYIGALALVLWYRLILPVINTFRYDMKVAEVIHEAPGVISLRITGRRLDKLGTKAGQFFFWRFFTKGFWYTQHPFSISEAPDGRSFRITVKDLGDHSAKFGQIPVGTRVFAEGPFGVFTDDSRTLDKSLLIAGGIGITPVRALMQNMGGNVVTLYRVVSPTDVVFSDELDRIADERHAVVHYVIGDHASAEGAHLLSPTHLKELVPDITERDVFICGPVGMIDSIVPSLRNANVSRNHLHVERFSL